MNITLSSNCHLPYVYKWTEISTGKWYIGSRTAKGCHPDDGYICSSKVVKPMIISHPENWKREILFTSLNADVVYQTERMLLSLYDAKNDPMSYNQHNGNGFTSFAGKVMSEQHKDKLRKANTGTRHTQKSRQKISKSKLGKTLTEETKQKMSKVKLGKYSGSNHPLVQTYKLTDPTGLIHIVDYGLSNFAKRHSLSESTLRYMIRKKKYKAVKGKCAGWEIRVINETS